MTRCYVTLPWAHVKVLAHGKRTGTERGAPTRDGWNHQPVCRIVPQGRFSEGVSKEVQEKLLPGVRGCPSIPSSFFLKSGGYGVDGGF